MSKSRRAPDQLPEPYPIRWLHDADLLIDRARGGDVEVAKNLVRLFCACTEKGVWLDPKLSRYVAQSLREGLTDSRLDLAKAFGLRHPSRGRPIGKGPVSAVGLSPDQRVEVRDIAVEGLLAEKSDAAIIADLTNVFVSHPPRSDGTRAPRTIGATTFRDEIRIVNKMIEACRSAGGPERMIPRRDLILKIAREYERDQVWVAKLIQRLRRNRRIASASARDA